MSDKKCSYDEMLEKIIEISSDDFSKPDAKLSAEDRKLIELASSIFCKPEEEVHQNLTDHALRKTELDKAEDDLKYGNLDEYGDDKPS